MANIKDVNVNLRKRFSDDTTLNLYPNTKSSNITNSDGTTVDEFIEKQELKNDTYDTMREKLDSVEYGAKKNQNAFSTVSISGRKVIDANKEKSDINIIPGDNVDISEVQGSLKISAKMDSVTQLANESKNGMMSSSDFKKLQGIEEGANKYTHPKSTTSGSFTSVTTDEYGHVVSGDTNPLPVAKGGTGVTSISAIKEELDVPLPTVDKIDGLTPNAVSAKTVFNALEGKANKEHGNHVPDSPATPDPQHFLVEGNTWKSLPTASNTTTGVTTIEDSIKYNEENDANNNITSTSAVTVRAVYNFLIQKETELVDGATSYTTFKSIEDYINTHKKEFEELNTTLETGDSNTLKSAKEYVDSEITKLVTGTNDNSVIDTFKEVQTWVGNHEELYQNLLKAVALKAEKTYVDIELGKKVDSTTYTTDINNLTNDVATKLNEKVDKITGKGLSTNDLTNDLVDKINNADTHSKQTHAPGDAEKNKIETISKNDVKINPDKDRNVNISVPTKVSELENDSKYLTSHPTISKANDTTNDKTIDTTIDDSFTVIDTVSRDDNGHLTAINTKTVKVPKREKVDIKTLTVGNGDSNNVTYNGSADKKIIIKQGTNVTVSFDNTTGVFTISSAMYTHPTTSGNKHIPSGGSSGQILRWTEDGTAAWGDDNNTTYDIFTGCSVATDGSNGLVPAPKKADTSKFLSSNGTWATPPNTVYTHPTTSGNKHIPSGGSSGQILRWSEDGTAAWGDETTYDLSGYFKTSGGTITGKTTFENNIAIKNPVKATDLIYLLGCDDTASGGTVRYIHRGDMVKNIGALSFSVDQGYITDEQKAIARKNIGAGTSSFSGSYTDLTNKPAFPSFKGDVLLTTDNVKTFRTTLKGDNNIGSFLATTRSNVTGIGCAPQYSPGFAFGCYDVQGYMNINYSTPSVIVGGGNGNALVWSKELAFKEHTHTKSEITDFPTIPSVGNGTITINQGGTKKGSFTMNQSGDTTIELTDNNTVYTHPTYTTKSSGLYKITVNGLGHVSNATAVTKADITALGIPSSDTDTWRGIQNNLTSTSTTDSLSANQGRILNNSLSDKASTNAPTINNATLAGQTTLNYMKGNRIDLGTSGTPAIIRIANYDDFGATTGLCIQGKVSNSSSTGGLFFPGCHKSIIPISCDNDGTYSFSNKTMDIGESSYRFRNVYAQSCTGSDEKIKENIKSLNDRYLALFDNIEIKGFTWKNFESEQKGDNPFTDTIHERTHVGVIAQEINSAVKKAGLTRKDFGAVITTSFIPSSTNKKICGGYQKQKSGYDYSENTYNYKHNFDSFLPTTYEKNNEILVKKLSSLNFEEYRHNIKYIMIEDNSKLTKNQPDVWINNIFLRKRNGEMVELKFDESDSKVYYELDDIEFKTPLSEVSYTENEGIKCSFNRMYGSVFIALDVPFNMDDYEDICFDIDFISQYNIYLIPDGKYVSSNLWDVENQDDIIFEHNVKYDEIECLSAFALKKTREEFKAYKETTDKTINDLTEKLNTMMELVTSLTTQKDGE